MGTSLITKKRIAKAFKTLLKDKEFDKVSVLELMDLAGIRRQTFYKYFLDKYELLDWIFETELEEQVTDNLTYISGLGLLEELCHYLENNQHFYTQAFAIKGQNDFSSFFLDYCLMLMAKIVSEESEKGGFQLRAEQEQFLTTYHANALVAMIKQQVASKQIHLVASCPYLVDMITISILSSKGVNDDHHS